MAWDRGVAILVMPGVGSASYIEEYLPVAARFIHIAISDSGGSVCTLWNIPVPRALSFSNSDFLSNKILQSNRICLNIPRTNLNV